MTVTHVWTQLGRTPGAVGTAGGAEDAATGGGTTDDPCCTGVEEPATGGGTTEDPCCTGADDAGGATEVEATGAMHLVQIVEIEVTLMVETVVETCWIGVPWGGVTVLVTGQVVTV